MFLSCIWPKHVRSPPPASPSLSSPAPPRATWWEGAGWGLWGPDKDVKEKALSASSSFSTRPLPRRSEAYKAGLPGRGGEGASSSIRHGPCAKNEFVWHREGEPAAVRGLGAGRTGLGRVGTGRDWTGSWSCHLAVALRSTRLHQEPPPPPSRREPWECPLAIAIHLTWPRFEFGEIISWWCDAEWQCAAESFAAALSAFVGCGVMKPVRISLTTLFKGREAEVSKQNCVQNNKKRLVTVTGQHALKY